MIDMITTSAQARRVIGQIDRHITVAQRQLFGRGSRTANECQAIRDRQPELTARFDAMYRARGQMQLVRNRAAYAEEMRHLRATKTIRAKKCPTCKGTGRA